MSSRNQNTALGLILGIFSLVSLIWWIPGDIETGIVVQDRYSVHIGDAMLPTACGLALLLLSIWLIFGPLVSKLRGKTLIHEAANENASLSLGNLYNLLAMAGISLCSIVLMVWAGPITVEFLNSVGFTDRSYRQLSDTFPYKFIGFALGGTAMVFGFVSWTQRRASWRAAAIAVAMVILLIVLYDVPFNNLLLPPNGSH